MGTITHAKDAVNPFSAFGRFLGSFGSCFAPLFKQHPLVDRIGLCDREPALLERFAPLSRE